MSPLPRSCTTLQLGQNILSRQASTYDLGKHVDPKKLDASCANEPDADEFLDDKQTHVGNFHASFFVNSVCFIFLFFAAVKVGSICVGSCCEC